MLAFHSQTSSAFSQDMDAVMLQCVWNIVWRGEFQRSRLYEPSSISSKCISCKHAGLFLVEFIFEDELLNLLDHVSFGY